MTKINFEKDGLPRELYNYYTQFSKKPAKKEFCNNDEEYSDDKDDEEIEIEDVEIDGKTYVTDDLKNGSIYDCDSDGEILENEDGDWIKIGYFKDSISFFI